MSTNKIQKKIVKQWSHYAQGSTSSYWQQLKETCFIVSQTTKPYVLIFLCLIFTLRADGEEITDTSCPKMCRCMFPVGIIKCTNQNLSVLPENISSQVSEVDLSWNNFDGLPRLPPDFKIKTLLLAHNRIFTIDKMSLQSGALEKLDLSHNSIKKWSKIQPNVLSGTNKLRELDLSHNPIQKLDYNSPVSSSSLEILSMQNCSLTAIPSDFLSKLVLLKHFIISHNKFIVLPILYSRTLIRLDVSRCHVSELPAHFLSNLPALQTLYMSNNDEFRIIRQLKSASLTLIDATNCNLGHANFTELWNLTQALLAGNRLMKISTKYFRNPKLRSLDLSSNTIKHVDVDAFSDLVALETLDLSTNVFSELKSTTFTNNKKLKILNLSRTYLTHMTRFDSSSLLSLDMSYNEIQSLHEDSLTLMSSLQVFKFSRNLIKWLPRTIISNSLRELDLSTCQLFSIKNETFAYMPKLEYLNLAGNKFTTLQESYLPRNLKIINLDNNPWRCECHAVEFRRLYKYLVKAPSKISNENRLVCQSPENVSGYAWYQACAYVWYNENTDLNKRLWYYMVPVTVATILLVAAVYLRIHQNKVKREQRERRHQQLLAQERIRVLRIQQQRERAQQNAPDPRDSVQPPSYTEAIRMPPMNSNLGSNPELAKRNRRKKNARRKQPKNAEGRTKADTSDVADTNDDNASSSAQSIPEGQSTSQPESSIAQNNER